AYLLTPTEVPNAVLGSPSEHFAVISDSFPGPLSVDGQLTRALQVPAVREADAEPPAAKLLILPSAGYTGHLTAVQAANSRSAEGQCDLLPQVQSIFALDSFFSENVL